MKASLLFERHQLFVTESGKLVEVHRPFAWVSVEAAIELFRKKLTTHFGALVETPNDGGQA